jgi:hypothetical protein
MISAIAISSFKKFVVITVQLAMGNLSRAGGD